MNYCMPQRLPGGNSGSLIQHDFSGAPAFQHCTRLKPNLGGFPSPGLVLNRAECEAHLAELREKWHGKLWFNDAPTVEEFEWMRRLEGRVFRYERHLPGGVASRPFRLLEDGRVGRGLARLEVSWSVFVEAGSPLLVISSIDDVPTMVMRPAEDGSWRGAWLEHERCAVKLAPEEAAA
jgi:hypothetical protein